MMGGGGTGGGVWASVGGSGRLECYARAHPRPSFSWARRDGLELLHSDKYSQDVQVGGVEGREYLLLAQLFHRLVYKDCKRKVH